MKEQFKIYTAKNGSKYIQTKNFRLASSIAYLFNVRFYKLTVPSGEVFSFQYSDELLNAIETLDKIKIN